MSIFGYEIAPFSFVYVNPWMLWSLLLVPAFILLYVYRQRRGENSVLYSSVSHFSDKVVSSTLPIFKHVVFGLKMLALSFIILALSRPQAPQNAESFQKKFKEGIDIVISLDVSGSMLAQDLKPDRLEASKNIAMEFIEDRPNDRIGLVVFEGQSFTQSPITTDHNVLKQIFEDVETGMVEGGTAIGMGLATAVNRLRESKTKSKVVILLTDGVNNRGDIDPITAGQIAKEMGVRVYCIGVGTDDATAPTPIQTPFGTKIQQIPVEIDEEVLQEISEITGGKYFRATDNSSLKSIYSEIDKLETSKVNVIEFKEKPPEKFHGFLLLSLLVILPTYILEQLLLKSVST